MWIQKLLASCSMFLPHICATALSCRLLTDWRPYLSVNGQLSWTMERSLSKALLSNCCKVVVHALQQCTKHLAALETCTRMLCSSEVLRFQYGLIPHEVIQPILMHMTLHQGDIIVVRTADVCDTSLLTLLQWLWCLASWWYHCHCPQAGNSEVCCLLPKSANSELVSWHSRMWHSKAFDDCGTPDSFLKNKCLDGGCTGPQIEFKQLEEFLCSTNHFTKHVPRCKLWAPA